MKKFKYIICSAPVEDRVNNLDIYDSFDLVSRGLTRAVLTEDSIGYLQNFNFPFDLRKIDLIISSSSAQTIATAGLLKKIINNKKVPLIKSNKLDKIKFSMPQIIAKEIFKQLPYKDFIVQARRGFINNLYQNKLPETLAEVISRIQDLLKLLNSHHDKNILCISHAFYMRLIRLYLIDRHIFDSQAKLIKNFNPNHKPFEPLEGFFFNH